MKRVHHLAMPTVAIVIPVFNRDELLVRAMKSAAAQVHAADEVIIVDDASDDPMSESREFADENGFRWIRLPENSGVAAARNAGAKATQSDWICFLDSDDEWLPRKLQMQLNWHLSHPEFEISQVQEGWYRQGSLVKKPAHWCLRGGDLFADSVERCSIGPSCVMLSRSLWDGSGGFNEQLRVCEDYALWLKIAARVPIGLVDGEPLVRKHAGHGDQLSVVTPAMDRFRVHALIQALIRIDLSDQQRSQVFEGIRAKAQILEQGAVKRDLRQRSDFYREVSEEHWEALSAAQIQHWLQRSGTMLEG